MFNLENFHTLKEVQSLDYKMGHHLKQIKSEEERVQSLTNLRQKREDELNAKSEELKNLRIDLRSQEKTLHETSQRLEKSKNRIPLLTTAHEISATEKEIETLKREKETLEEKVLEGMEKIDLLEIEIQTLQTFLKGSEKSLEDIKMEVQKNIEKEKQEITNYQKRIDSLLATCPSTMKSRFLSLNETYRFRNPLAFVIDDTCSGCKMSVNRRDQSNIDKGLTLEYCSSCGRIFLPSSLM